MTLTCLQAFEFGLDSPPQFPSQKSIETAPTLTSCNFNPNDFHWG